MSYIGASIYFRRITGLINIAIMSARSHIIFRLLVKAAFVYGNIFKKGWLEV